VNHDSKDVRNINDRVEPYLTINLTLDKIKTTVERQTVDFVTMAGMIGGVAQLLFIVCDYIVGLWRDKKLTASLLHHLYQIKKIPDIMGIKRDHQQSHEVKSWSNRICNFFCMCKWMAEFNPRYFMCVCDTKK